MENNSNNITLPLPAISQAQQDFMAKLKSHAERAVSFSSAEVKQRVAVRSPQGGYRMEVQVIKSR